MALTSLAVTAVGAPTVYSAARSLMGAQQLVEDAELAERAVSLAHALAEERDTLVIALAGPSPDPAAALDPSVRSRSDRRVDELRADAPAPLLRRLETLADTREQALSGDAGPLAVHDAYSLIITQLDAVTRSVSRERPERAADPVSGALPDLARAVDASAATRGLLAAALLLGGDQPELVQGAQRARAREEAALADFATTGGARGQDVYDTTVTGPEAAAAAGYLQAFTAAPGAAPAAELREAGAEQVAAALAARTELQRGVLASLVGRQTENLRELRADDLTALQLRVALVAAAVLLAAGISVATARSLTRPLAVVRLGTRRVASDPAGQEPVRYIGRNDEFAEVIAAVNALHARAVTLQREAGEATADRGDLHEEHHRLTAERQRLLTEQQELSRRLAALHGAVHGTFAHHADRILALAAEQLAVLERLEQHETDPDHLATLFSLDHLAARVRRHGENLLLLAGAERPAPPDRPLPLVDVLRAAVSEIERYELVEIDQPVPELLIEGFAVRDISHLLAELLDNATAFSPPHARVGLAGRTRPDGGAALLVTDEGIGMTGARLAELNERLAEPGDIPPPGADGDPGIGMGMYTVARLVARHGLHVSLRLRAEGGIAAEVILPPALVLATDPEAQDPAAVAAVAAVPAEPADTLWTTGAAPATPATGPADAAPAPWPPPGAGIDAPVMPDLPSPPDAAPAGPDPLPVPDAGIDAAAEPAGGSDPGGAATSDPGPRWPAEEPAEPVAEPVAGPVAEPAVEHDRAPAEPLAEWDGQDPAPPPATAPAAPHIPVRQRDRAALRAQLEGFTRGARAGERAAAAEEEAQP
ncbi:sensor histidine kinase [Streptomyces aidingensis]|uniref:histidine kinase n=1 Tax=Streptomyces aidingensis TaxID=910347 RepID=A0A1I1TMP4_9ACTN|nr:nitrate- and nitrite sensing domain-containing protein [Streptomyces aidingensis]SFD59775.1 Signal transduction histidine kinase [Streptomyces aidingensis]